MNMEIFKLIGVIVLALMAVFCIKRIIFNILNIRALNHYKHDANPINQRQGIVLNKKNTQT